VVGATDCGRVRLARDPRLKRSVWIHVLPTDRPKVSAIIRNVSRPSRLHWLQGQRTASSAWDAYEAPDGQSLLLLASAQPWRSVSIWLADLARELAASTAEGSLDVLALDRIWITAAGRAKLLDFRAPGLTAGNPTTYFDVASAQQFLFAAAQHALGSPTPPLPLLASRCLRTLKHGEFGALSDIPTVLAELQTRPDRVTSTARGMTLGLGLVIYLLAGDTLGRMLINVAFPHLPSSVVGWLPVTASEAGLIGSRTSSSISIRTSERRRAKSRHHLTSTNLSTTQARLSPTQVVTRHRQDRRYLFLCTDPVKVRIRFLCLFL
jgi:hypothetical protein